MSSPSETAGPDPWHALARYAMRHHGVVAVSAARELGVSQDLIRAATRSGKLTRAAPRTYTVLGSPDTWHQRVMVATASVDGWASHHTAAALWGLDGFRRGQVEVLTYYDGRRSSRGPWRTHTSRQLAGVDLAKVDAIPCTSPPRTLLDLAAVAHPFQVGAALDDACRRWPGMLDIVGARFRELAGKGRPGVKVMRELLTERLGTGRFTQSGFEAQARRLVRSVGLPDPVPQYRVRDGDFTAYIDLAWPVALWGLECDSLAWHSGKRAHEWDRLRRRRLKSLGWDMVEVTYDDVMKRPQSTGRQLKRLYEARVAGVARSAHRHRHG